VTKQEQLYGIRHQLDLLGYRADRLKPGPRRDRARCQNAALTHPVPPRLGFLALNPKQHEPHLTRCGSSPSACS